jgi:hypothetical protein
VPRCLARASAISAVGALSVGGAGLLSTALAAPAAAADTCTPIDGAPAATVVVTGVCQVVVTDSGSYTIPASIAKVSAVVLGAGGGADVGGNGSSTYAAGGGGGQLVYIDSVATGAPLTVAIGAGGTGSTAGAGGAGGNTTFDGATALGGGGGTAASNPTTSTSYAIGGASGNGNVAVPGATVGTGTAQSLSGGGGARTGAPDGSGTAGAGWSLSAFVAAQSGDATLFPSAADGGVNYGDGGAASAASLTQATAYGDGGVGTLTDASSGVGGAVILRYAATASAPPSPTTNPPATTTNPAPPASTTTPAGAGPSGAALTELAATGSDAPFGAVAGGLGMTAAGAAIAAFARLRRRGANARAE